MPEFEGRLQAVWGLIVILRSRRDGILEYYWGEHIHLGYYSEEERARGYKKKDFKQAKLDFVDEMLAWSGARQPQRILDVGCGIGGTSRHLAATFPHAAVQGALAPLCSGKYPACSALFGLSKACMLEWSLNVSGMALLQGSRCRQSRLSAQQSWPGRGASQMSASRHVPFLT